MYVIEIVKEIEFRSRCKAFISKSRLMLNLTLCIGCYFFHLILALTHLYSLLFVLYGRSWDKQWIVLKQRETFDVLVCWEIIQAPFLSLTWFQESYITEIWKIYIFSRNTVIKNEDRFHHHLMWSFKIAIKSAGN